MSHVQFISKTSVCVLDFLDCEEATSGRGWIEEFKSEFRDP